MMWLVIILLLMLILAQWLALRDVTEDRDDYRDWFERQRKENSEVWRKYARTKTKLDKAEAKLARRANQ